MESFYLAFSVVFPLFINMVLGYGMFYLGILDEHSTDIMNRAVFKIFLPILLFVSIGRTDISQDINIKLIVYAVASIFIIFAILCLVIPRIEKDCYRRGVLIQGIFRSNFVLFGLPVATSICGVNQIQSVAMLIAVVVPMYNVLAVISLEMFRDGKIDWLKIIKGVIKNPLIIASSLSVLLLILKISLPNIIQIALDDLAGIATPLAIIMLGATFRFGAICHCWRQLIIGVIGKLILVPGIFIPIAILLGFEKVEIVGLLALYAAPNAVSSFTMAVQMDGDSELAGQIVVFSSVFSILTIFLWIFYLSHYHYI